MEENEDHPPYIGIIPRDIVTRILMTGYYAPDVRTAIFTVHSVAYALYPAFILSTLLFFLAVEDFFRLNFLISLVTVTLGTFVSFIQHGLNKEYDIRPFEWKLFIQNVLISLFLPIPYLAFYLIPYSERPQTPVKLYLVYVALHALFSGISAFIFSQPVIGLYKLWLKVKSRSAGQ